ncbi:hypothetical protein AB6A40_002639 [Gnathostoma spinigerum]|uniref:Reticulocalbin-3 n=1 Tax=Gnathostoma spinigerum TaxID=75299 RepID=A0ABD6EHZ3_9BILA
MVLRFVLLSVLLFMFVYGDEEHIAHGAASAKFRANHEGEGRHNVHMDHQAVLGSKKEAASFDDLTPEEAKSRLAVIAQRMDADKDGFITAEELTSWVQKSMLSLDDEETKERFEELDNDRDNFVSWKEYITDAFPEEMDENEQPDAEDMKLINEDKLYFQAADVDGDGKLSQNEFNAFQNPEYHPHMHDTLVKVTMLEKDKNKDGRIDRSEFLGEIGENPDSEWYTVEKNRFEEEYDVDKNGYLEGDEIKHWLIPDVQLTAKQEAEHLISEADKNNDGKLTVDEVLDAQTVFVGSEATNYGEKLTEVSHEEL